MNKRKEDFASLNLEGLNEVCKWVAKTGIPYNVKLPEKNKNHGLIYNYSKPFKIGYSDGHFRACIDIRNSYKDNIVRVFLEKNSNMNKTDFEALENLLSKLKKELGYNYCIIPDYINDGYCIAVYDEDGYILEQAIGSTIEKTKEEILNKT